MQLDVRSRDSPIGPRMRGFIERSVRFAFGRFGCRIRRVTMDLARTERRHSGTVRECRITVGLIGSRAIRAEDTDTDLKAAVIRAINRVTKAVDRAIEQPREATSKCGPV